MKTNTIERTVLETHEGGRAVRINAEQQLRRSVMSCMLWEGEFYEDGVSLAKRIADLVALVKPEKVAAIAVEAREKFKLRHVPLLLCRSLAKIGKLKAETLAAVIQRPDELTEFVSLYWKDGRCPLSNQVKRGLAAAFGKFNEYSLQKHEQDGKIKLRDVLFLCHAKPKDKDQEALWKRLIEGAMAIPDTWEVELSKGGSDKKASWERLLQEKKLGGLAFLRNLRNMKEADVSKSLVKKCGPEVNFARVLPFRFVAAARAVPAWEDAIEPLFLSALTTQEKLPGKTVLIVDVSGSMYGAGNISAKSDMTRVDAAGALAAIAREVCEECSIYATAGNDGTRIHATAAVPGRRGFALCDLFSKNGFANTLGGGGIFLVQCLDFIQPIEKTADRVIVFTDEQDCDTKLRPDQAKAFGTYNYLINIASHKNGIGYGKWVHIDGFSEASIEYIREHERQ